MFKDVQRKHTHTPKKKRIPKNPTCHMSPPQFPHMAPVSFPSAARDKGGKKTSTQPSCPGRLPFESTLIGLDIWTFNDIYIYFFKSKNE
jgi:hypothetical protein